MKPLPQTVVVERMRRFIEDMAYGRGSYASQQKRAVRLVKLWSRDWWPASKKCR